MICVRLARAHTGRRKILKFWGHFHGLHEFVMYNAHLPNRPVEPGSLIRPAAESTGVPEMMDDLVVVIPWKDPAALDKALAEHGQDIAAIIMEPINYNQGCIVADADYMQLVRDRATGGGVSSSTTRRCRRFAPVPIVHKATTGLSPICAC